MSAHEQVLLFAP